MEPQIIDYVFFGFIAIVAVGGIIALMVLLPKDHALEERTQDCYRIMFRDGKYTITHKKASLGENVYSLRSRYFYIKKAPFQVDAFCDSALSTASRMVLARL